MPEQMLTLAAWNILAACYCIVFLVYFLLQGRCLRREVEAAEADIDALREKARLYDEMQEQIAAMGTLVDARAASVKAYRESRRPGSPPLCDKCGSSSWAEEDSGKRWCRDCAAPWPREKGGADA